MAHVGNRMYKKEPFMSAAKPPVMTETQTWKSYEELLLRWMRITTIAPEKIVGVILAIGIHKHAIIHKLAENLEDDYAYFDIFDREDLPNGWLAPGDEWDAPLCTPYTPGKMDFDRTKYETL